MIMDRLVVDDAPPEGQQSGPTCCPPATVAPIMPIACTECARNGIEREVTMTVDLATHHFTPRGQPAFEIIDDPECHENYLAIHVDVSGDPESVFQQSESFIDEFVTSIDGSK
jgi:hypothetical protein